MSALKLPPLPAPDAYLPYSGPNWGKDERPSGYFVGDEKLRAYGLACWKQGIEDAAKVCDDLGAQDKLSNYHKVAALAICRLAKEITP